MNIETILRAERLCEKNNAQKTPCGHYVMMVTAEVAEPFVRELTRGCREHTVLGNLPTIDAEDCGFDSATHEVHVHARVSDTVIVTLVER